MEILWQTIESNNYELDYYAITICKGKRVKEKVYYLLPKEEQSRKTGQFCLDYLIDNGIMRCFSFGVNNIDAALKYDFQLQTDFCELAYDVFSDGIDFFDAEGVRKVFSVIEKNRLPWANRIVGCRIKENILQNLSVYFSCIDEKEYTQVQNIIEELLGVLSMNTNDAVFFKGENSWLHLVALDFSNEFCKLKLYFKFKKEYDLQQIIKEFEITENHEIVKEIVNSNAYIEGIQVAFSKDQQASYCFYLKKDN